MVADGPSMFIPLDAHPIPLEQSAINEIWADDTTFAPNGEPPSVDEAHCEYTDTVAEYGEWHVFKPRWPFDAYNIVIWNRALGTGYGINDTEGRWHNLVNLFAAIVEEEGDCRDADYSDSLRQSGASEQRCLNCGESWSTG
jgi:hypothetical protein